MSGPTEQPIETGAVRPLIRSTVLLVAGILRLRPPALWANADSNVNRDWASDASQTTIRVGGFYGSRRPARAKPPAQDQQVTELPYDK
jgi:hypothetical protein